MQMRHMCVYIAEIRFAVDDSLQRNSRRCPATRDVEKVNLRRQPRDDFGSRKPPVPLSPKHQGTSHRVDNVGHLITTALLFFISLLLLASASASS